MFSKPLKETVGRKNDNLPARKKVCRKAKQLMRTEIVDEQKFYLAGK
jgi:hypothetical protein